MNAKILQVPLSYFIYIQSDISHAKNEVWIKFNLIFFYVYSVETKFDIC